MTGNALDGDAAAGMERHSYDVLVIGAGGSGLRAAIAAHEAGATPTTGRRDFLAGAGATAAAAALGAALGQKVGANPTLPTAADLPQPAASLPALPVGLEEQVRGIDPTDPSSLQRLVEGGMFDLPKSPLLQAALERLEVVLALVEGWVDEVVGQATATRMPAAAKLQEAVRRRRAAGGPAEETFAALVGLELRPRRLRDASTLWGSLRTRQGVEARDGVWMHPHLLPTAADLDDPLGFRADATAPDALSEEDFDAELRKLLDGPSEPGDE